MQHWYGRDGETRYEVKKADGTTRDYTLRDARKEGALFSYSTIKAMASNPGITNYQLKSLSRAWWDHANEFADLHEFEDAHRLAKRHSEGHRDSSAEWGSKLHKAVEDYIRGQSEASDPMTDYVAPAVELLSTVAPLDTWLPELVFANKELGYGGMVDLVNVKHDAIIDVKTQGFEKKPNKYREWIWQLAAYSEALGMHGARCGNLVVSSERPGDCHLIWYTDDELQDAWLEFDCLRQFTFLRKNYDPRKYGL